MHQVLKGRHVWWHHHVGVFFTSLLFLIQNCVVSGIKVQALSENLFGQYLTESYRGRSSKTSCISFSDSVSCEDLKGVGSLNSTCLINSNLHLDDDLCLYGTGNFVVSQHVSIICPIKGCSITVNVSGSVEVGPYAEVVAGSVVFGATNFTLYHHSTINTASLGGQPPAQTSGTPTGHDGAGGGHGGRGASCLKSNKTNWGGDVYAWSTLSDPWSYGSKGGSTSAERQYGGDGGGRVMVKVNDSLIVDGTISAEGGRGSLEGGGGSGGSIIVHALKL